ncbi:sensor histidine kinase [Lysobacter korlensis]|uniref:histidine kinase n=1 Tax=Lysobacter korlensis TaxID=553636 RepID=A0ABV6RHL2_9GAMM
MRRWTDRVAHDLKGPLAPIQTATFLLRSDVLPPERQRELIDVIDRQTRRLNRMIEEFGDWNRAEQQRLVGQRVRTPLAMVLDLAIGSVPGLSTDPRFAAGLEAAEVEADESRLVQLFNTLLAHLSARDPAHSPELHVEPAPAGLRVVLADRGPALDEAGAAGLFDAPLPAPADEGLGLRLLIADAIARAHGGQLRASPRDGGGLQFECELPLA